MGTNMFQFIKKDEVTCDVRDQWNTEISSNLYYIELEQKYLSKIFFEEVYLINLC